MHKQEKEAILESGGVYITCRYYVRSRKIKKRRAQQTTTMVPNYFYFLLFFFHNWRLCEK